ncbi:MAG: hypothetical protein HYS05_11540 [Acidobacteria bacterium]|nr:hypothetical protein [Acidobacteriota bacterium]
MTPQLAAGLFVVAVSLGPQTPSPIAPIQKIHVMPVGQDHEAVRFRKLLVDDLLKAGFAVVADERDADAILSGTLTTPVVDGHSRAYAEMELMDRNGRRVWGRNFPSRRRWPSGQDYVRKLAEEIAAAMKSASVEKLTK